MGALLRGLKISHRLYGGFAIVLILMAGAVTTTLVQITGIDAVNTKISTHRTPTALTGERLVGQVHASLAALRGYLLTGNPRFVEERTAIWHEIEVDSAQMDELATHWTNPVNVSDWQGFKAIEQEFKAAQDKVESMYNAADIAPAVAVLLAEAAPRAEKLLAIMDGEMQPGGTRVGGMVERQTKLLGEESAAAGASIGMLTILQWVLLGLGLGLGGLIAYVTARGITRPMLGMTNAMGDLAEGKLETDVPGRERSDEIGSMAAAVEVFKQNAIKVQEMNAAEAVRAGQTRERTHAMNELIDSLTGVVEAAVDGDFSRRIEVALKDDDLRGVASSVNELVDTVDRGLSETGDVLSALAETNLTQRVRGDFKGAFLKLKDDTNAVGDKLTEIVTQLRDTSRALKTATGEILSGANDLAERTTKQAAAIEETSAAMEQLATTVTENAKRADSASGKARAVAKTAQETGGVMTEANGAMEKITSSSAKISNIIGMIDDIAFQTNLLALNASVEAARAGDAGKGFAVVAVEVRRLAQSAASASAEVKVLIEQSAGEVKGGSQLVADAAAKLISMLDAVQENSTLIDGIAQASQEQSSAIAEVTTAVRQMDEMTQHNAALVEETNAAIEQTEGQASELDRIVDVFVIDGGSTQTAPRAVAADKPQGARALQDKVKTAARSYLSQGNAAVKQDWSEF